MDIQYYIQYIVSWFYHNVIQTETSYALLRIFIIIALVSLVVYQHYLLFLGLCMVVLYFECMRNDDGPIQRLFDELVVHTSGHRTVAKDELTTGVSVGQEGFSIGPVKIIRGDDSGTDHRRSNKFIEDDSLTFTDKYFKSKRCSIGSGMGAVTMFGSNELIGSRQGKVNSTYDYAGKWTPNDSSGSSEMRFIYFKECVYDPIYRDDFRIYKTNVAKNVNESIIDISMCLSRFNTAVLFNTKSEIGNDFSSKLSSSSSSGASSGASGAAGTGFQYVSLINGRDNNDKLQNIDTLSTMDNKTDRMYSNLLKTTNSDDALKKDYGLKQRYLDTYGKVYGYRKRIDKILATMRAQVKNDSSLLYTIRVSESVVQELRMILGYLALLQRTSDIIAFERTGVKIGADIGIWTNVSKTITANANTIGPFMIANTDLHLKISGNNNLFKIPLDDSTYNTNDEMRYLYGITYYFDKVVSTTPYD